MNLNWIPMVDAFARPMAWALIHSLWQGAVVAVIAGAVLAGVPAARARLRYAISCAALMVIVFATCTTGIYFIASERISPPAAAIQQAESSKPAALQQAQSSTPVIEQTPSTDIGSISSVSLALADVIFGLWLLGVLTFSLYHFLGWRKASGLARNGVRELPVSLAARISRLCKEMGLRRRFRVFESALVRTPCVIGWLRPVLLVPVSVITGLSTRQLEMIVAHELAHIQRYDVLVNYVQTAVETLLFFNPAIWWISRRVRFEREHCCDDLAAEVCGDRLLYARALTRLEQLRGLTPSTVVAADGTPLLYRIRRLAGIETRSGYQSRAGLVGAFLLSISIALAAGWFGGLVSPDAAAETRISTWGDYAPAGDDLDGRWYVDPDGDELTIRLKFKSRSGTSSFSIYLEELPESTLLKDNGFRIERDAGTFYCEGRLEDEDGEIYGSGRCYFRMNPDYIDQMKSLGFRITSPRKAFELALHDVTLEFARGLHDLGYKGFSLDKLIELDIHNVTPTYVDELRQLGYTDLRLSRLVEMRIHDVDPEYIQDLAAAGYTDLRPSRLVEMQIHNVDLGYIEALRDLGYTDISPAKLVEMRIHDVDPYFIEELADLGYTSLSPSRLVEMQIHDVDPYYIRELKELGYDDISPAKLVEMRIHNVTADFIQRQIERGHKDLSPSDLVEMRIHGWYDNSSRSSSRSRSR